MTKPRLLDADKVLEVVERRMALAAEAVECELHDELWKLLDDIRSLPCADTGEVERLSDKIAGECDYALSTPGLGAGDLLEVIEGISNAARAALNKQEVERPAPQTPGIAGASQVASEQTRYLEAYLRAALTKQEPDA